MTVTAPSANNLLKGLDASTIKGLLSNNRARNTYGPKILEFVNSDEAAVNPRDAWPLEFSEKKATAMYQSFRKEVANAKLDDTIKVIQRDGEVYLLHMERSRLLVESEV